MSPPRQALKAYLKAEIAFTAARKKRNEARTRLTSAIKHTMRANKLNQGVVARRLKGWPTSRLGNILHNAQAGPTEKEWGELLEAVSAPMTEKEKEQSKRQPKRIK